MQEKWGSGDVHALDLYNHGPLIQNQLEFRRNLAAIMQKTYQTNQEADYEVHEGRDDNLKTNV